jgi:hypothetical protein
MFEISEDDAYENVEIEFIFSGVGPEFGDLFTVCGYENPNFPPKGKFNFESLMSFDISQIDDYFGILSKDQKGDDVSVWLYPTINGEKVDHHPGPFDGLCLSYCTLRNPKERINVFLELASIIEKTLPVTLSESTNSAKRRIYAIIEFWEKQGVKVGSDESLQVDY